MGGSWLTFSGVPFVVALLAQPLAGGWVLDRMTRADREARLGHAVLGLLLAAAAMVGLVLLFDRPGARDLMPVAFVVYAVGWTAVAFIIHRPGVFRGLAAALASAAVAAVVSVMTLIATMNLR